ncbi:F0F1 ATP synthase subunit B [Mesorhizobium sp. NBSH29]|uniref:F0F1 ATP synthase subunit B n=1 Tax=Mesorhizobium sp. NBSH29 TaxID=2654249 RepID=UPI00189679BA|nr:F0F1 ATP synthase subunit B [Mesorhizobium sp. NBSH29]QPC86973.1 F0F1 ATP synthase subunit B [Mesorhizobium sp. NBSH29]
MFVTPGYAEEAPASVGGETHAGVEAGNGGGSFPPFDPSTFPSQLLWLAITFGLFYLILQRAVLPRIGGILEVRSERIRQDLDQAGRLKEEADAAVAAYEQALAEARANANAIGQDARDSAKLDAEAERKRVETNLDKKLAEAEARISLIKSAAMKEVGTIAENTAAAIVQQLVNGKMDKATIAAAVKAAR